MLCRPRTRLFYTRTRAGTLRLIHLADPVCSRNPLTLRLPGACIVTLVTWINNKRGALVSMFAAALIDQHPLLRLGLARILSNVPDIQEIRVLDPLTLASETVSDPT